MKPELPPTPPTPLSVRSEHRMRLWPKHIECRANKDGIWHSNKRSRAGLPDKIMSDDNRHRFLGRMVAEGKLERVGKGKYRVIQDG